MEKYAQHKIPSETIPFFAQSVKDIKNIKKLQQKSFFVNISQIHIFEKINDVNIINDEVANIIKKKVANVIAKNSGVTVSKALSARLTGRSDNTKRTITTFKKHWDLNSQLLPMSNKVFQCIKMFYDQIGKTFLVKTT